MKNRIEEAKERDEKGEQEHNQNETRKLLDNIMAHPELHDLITHLGDFKHAVDHYTKVLEAGIYRSEEEYESTFNYWHRQRKVLDKLLRITKYC